LVVQNSKTGPPGYFGRYLKSQCGATLRVVNPQELPSYDEVANVELIVVLGSANGVYEQLAWIERERTLVREALAAKHPMIGICFGAQIIASALGADVSAGKPYRGWLDNDDVTAAIWRGPWLRWHGDRLAAPAGAEIFARSEGTIQAFQVGRAIGIQFHPEADASIVTEWLQIASSDARARLDIAGLLAESDERFRTMEPARARLFHEVLTRTVG